MTEITRIYENDNFRQFAGLNGNELYANQSVALDQSMDNAQLPQLLHWSDVVYEFPEVQVEEWSVAGGSDYGQLPYLLETGDIILEIDNTKVAGFTRNDVLELLRSSPRHTVKAVSSSSSFGLPIDLREYLSRRFVKGSGDHELQATIRDNVYLRTVPCTTRPARPNEIDGVDYKFVTRDEFLMMEKSGVLLESGIFSGHYYGTPLPLSAPTTPMLNGVRNSHSNMFNHRTSINGMNGDIANGNGNHVPTIANSASKRKRNRSNIAAIDASTLPQGWEKINDANYGVYYIDHVNKRTQYERPYELELTKGVNGFGFTLIELDRGLVLVKNVIPGGPAYSSGVIQSGDVLVSVSGVSVSGMQHADVAKLFSAFMVGDRVKLTFARGYQLPQELNQPEEDFEYFSIPIERGDNGFGFTISDGNTGQKVKKILDPERCGSLKQGDILYTVNGVNLSNLPHTQVVEILKQCPIGETANLMVKRRKRFRSKTPILQSTNYEMENHTPSRNCKTPSAEMMARRDADWFMNDTLTNPPILEVNGNQQMMAGAPFDVNLNTSNPVHNDGYVTSPAIPIPNSKSAPQLINPQIAVENAVVSSEEEFEYHRVDLTKGDAGFGFRIIGGSEEGRSVAVGSIVIGGVAHTDGILKSGDEIVTINGHDVTGSSHQEVVHLMSLCGACVSLLVRRKKDSDSYEVVLCRGETEDFGFVIISCGRMCLIGRITEDSPAQRCQRLRVRDRIIAVNGVDITSMSHPDIVNMIKESGRTLCLKIIPTDCYSVELVRGPRGFGFSIRGGAEFDGMPLFILRIAHDGPAFSLINVGDQIVEINNVSTIGMTHTEAVQLISQSGPQVKLKLKLSYCPRQ